jgi:hypothetical protein
VPAEELFTDLERRKGPVDELEVRRERWRMRALRREACRATDGRQSRRRRALHRLDVLTWGCPYGFVIDEGAGPCQGGVRDRGWLAVRAGGVAEGRPVLRGAGLSNASGLPVQSRGAKSGRLAPPSV